MTNSPQTPNNSTLLTIPEAAQQLRISKWTMYQLIRTKELKTLTIASRRFVAYNDLADFINQRREDDT